MTLDKPTAPLMIHERRARRLLDILLTSDSDDAARAAAQELEQLLASLPRPVSQKVDPTGAPGDPERDVTREVWQVMQISDMDDHVVPTIMELGEGQFTLAGLIAALGHDDGDVRRVAALILQEIDPPAPLAIPGLARLAASNSECLDQVNALITLATWGKASAHAVPALRAALGSRGMTRWAALALGRVGAVSIDALKDLGALIGHPNALVSETARDAVANIVTAFLWTDAGATPTVGELMDAAWERANARR